MDFAPYQDDSPSDVRAKSPSPRGSRAASPRPQSPSFQSHRNINSVIGSGGGGGAGVGNGGGQQYQHLPDPTSFGSSDVEAGGYQGYQQEGGNSGRTYIDLFETSLPLRLDYEAMAAYLLLPPLGGVLLLIFEHKSDYVRFHAWQSALLFSAMFILHLIFSAVAFISWLLLIVDLGLIAFLTLRAYKDADTLDRYEIPPFGRYASGFVDDE